MIFFDTTLFPLEALDKTYNPYLVICSVLVAIISSFTAFGTTERIQASSAQVEKFLWILFGATSMGVGVWTMHFIALLAMQLPVRVSYNLNIALISVIPVILASGVVLWLMSLSKTEFDQKRLLICGFIFGAGIGLMHFVGMAAMELSIQMAHIKSVFILSIIVAVILATIALKIQYLAVWQDKYQFINNQKSAGALVMGLALSGIHYTAMNSTIFIPLKKPEQLMTGNDTSVLLAIISVAVILQLTVALMVPRMLRFKQMVQELQANEEALNIAAIAFQTHEAIMVTDANTTIIRINQAFTRITGYTEVDVIGKSPEFLKSGKHDVFFYKKFWSSLNTTGHWNGEIWNRRKNGEIFPAWQTVSAIYNEQHKLTHYISFFSDITEYKDAEKEIEKLAFYDTLTGLPNRHLLHERLGYELNAAARYNRAGIVFSLDLDRFKDINVSLGHSMGDLLLVEIAKRLQSLIRNVDTVARLGGDEFVVLMSAQDGIDANLLEQSNTIAEKISEEVSRPYLINGQKLYISTSIGIALYTGIDETVDLLLKRADTAMYQAKESGRDTYRFYQQSMQKAVDERLSIESHLRSAISNNEFSIHYQPQLSESNQVVGAEALIRWKNSTLGHIPPVDFIPIAEETGLIVPIGKWIVKSVCEQITLWERQRVKVPHVAINISAKQFHQADFVSVFMAIVFEQNVQPSKIMLEITEGVFLGNLEEAIDKMNVLKKNGFRFSIDDFGTGYSSLTYLKQLPFDQLKIDQSFVRGVVNSATDAAIVKAIIVMAKSMGLNLIAEGVETEQHLSYLSGFGCHYYQGYFFSRPLDSEQLSEYVKKHDKTRL